MAAVLGARLDEADGAAGAGAQHATPLAVLFGQVGLGGLGEGGDRVLAVGGCGGAARGEEARGAGRGSAATMGVVLVLVLVRGGLLGRGRVGGAVVSGGVRALPAGASGERRGRGLVDGWVVAGGLYAGGGRLVVLVPVLAHEDGGELVVLVGLELWDGGRARGCGGLGRGIGARWARGLGRGLGGRVAGGSVGEERIVRVVEVKEDVTRMEIGLCGGEISRDGCGGGDVGVMVMVVVGMEESAVVVGDVVVEETLEVVEGPWEVLCGLEGVCRRWWGVGVVGRGGGEAVWIWGGRWRGVTGGGGGCCGCEEAEGLSARGEAEARGDGGVVRVLGLHKGGPPGRGLGLGLGRLWGEERGRARGRGSLGRV